MAGDEALTLFALGCIALATVGFGAVALLFTALLSKGITSLDKLVVVWCVYDAITHFFLVS